MPFAIRRTTRAGGQQLGHLRPAGALFGKDEVAAGHSVYPDGRVDAAYAAGYKVVTTTGGRL
ncbi:hypothetical protein ABZ912_46980 [Nonomuraea angiospora]|uniref:hypothetical protein n=1 Tax=Nonomuraea angiospora TaxID=46172 RepID=UPI0033F1A6B3